MYIPKTSTRATHTSSEPRHELLNNPITYEIILITAVVCLATLILQIMRCLQSCTAPDDDYYYYDEDARPLLLPLAADGELLDESGGKYRQYGTFFDASHGKWYGADGMELSYDEWVVGVYDPLD